MADFGKLIGVGGEETNLNFLRKEVARLSAANAALNQELIVRAAPRTAEAMDALAQLADLAVAGHPQAKALLQRYFDVLDRARSAAGSIAVARINGS